MEVTDQFIFLAGDGIDGGDKGRDGIDPMALGPSGDIAQEPEAEGVDVGDGGQTGERKGPEVAGRFGDVGWGLDDLAVFHDQLAGRRKTLVGEERCEIFPKA